MVRSGGSDIMVRTVAPFVEKYLGNDANIVVENRTGASGVVGWTALHDAEPDGYTIGIITTPSIVTKADRRESQVHLEGLHNHRKYGDRPCSP